MTADPLQEMLGGIDRPVTPRPEFAGPLLVRLLAELEAESSPSPSPIAASARVVDLHRDSRHPWEHVPTLSQSTTMGEGLGAAKAARAARAPFSAVASVSLRLPRPRVHLATGALVVVALIASVAAPRLGQREPAPLTLDPAPPARVPGAPVVSFAWETQGAPNRPLANPSSLAVDPEGNVWVSDTRNDHFQVFAPDGAFLETWDGGSGQDQGSAAPAGLGAAAFDADGNLYVIDAEHHRIQKFGPDRALLTAWGSQGDGAGQFRDPVDVAIDAESRIYVADRGRRDIQKFDATGRLLDTFSDFAGGDGQRSPIGLALDDDGDLWVAFDRKRRIQQLSSEGDLLGVFSTYGAFGPLGRPTDLAINDAGQIFAVDGEGQIQILRDDGRFLGAFNGPAVDASESARRLAFDDAGQLYVLLRDRVQAFQVEGPEE